MYRETCPCCDVRFPFFGPKMLVMNPRSFRSRVEYECPACACRLERRYSAAEKLLETGTSLGMLASCVLSIFKTTFQLPSEILIATMSLAVVGYLLILRNECVKQRFFHLQDS